MTIRPFAPDNGYTRFHNASIDYIMPHLNGSVWMLLCVIIRHTTGWHTDCALLTYDDLVTKTGLHRNTVRDAIQDAIMLELIIREAAGASFTYAINEDFEIPAEWLQGQSKKATDIDTKKATAFIELKKVKESAAQKPSSAPPTIPSQQVLGNEADAEAAVSLKDGAGTSAVDHVWQVLQISLKSKKQKTFYCQECGNEQAVDLELCRCPGHGGEVHFRLPGGNWVKPKKQPIMPNTPAAAYLREATAKYAIPWLGFETTAEKTSWEMIEKAVGGGELKKIVDWALQRSIPRSKLVSSILTAAKRNGKVEERQVQDQSNRIANERQNWKLAGEDIPAFSRVTGRHPHEYFLALANEAPDIFEAASGWSVAQLKDYLKKNAI